MANQELLSLLERGVNIWNRWREDYPEMVPDLSGADISHANLTNSNLSGADISHANLTNSNLSETNLTDAILSNSQLKNVNLRKAILINTNFSGARFNNTDLTEVQIGFTLFTNNDLSTTKGLDTILHIEPSSIGIDTIYRSQGHIPAIFLQNAGVPSTFISYMRSLVSQPIEYYTCFISYSSKDSNFARRLHEDLQAAGVRCWFAPEDMDIGDSIRSRIEESIRLYDKLLLILSEHSLTSQWVAYEVERALAKEHVTRQTILFPISIDNSIMSSIFSSTAALLKTKHIGDFQDWDEPDKYQRELSRLIKRLKISAVNEKLDREPINDK